MKKSTKKKSKFRHILINKKKYYFYTIKWIDILGDAGHADVKEFCNMKPANMVTQAYIFKKNDKCVWTFASYDENEESFSDRNVFPKGVITEMKRIIIWK